MVEGVIVAGEEGTQEAGEEVIEGGQVRGKMDEELAATSVEGHSSRLLPRPVAG
jgi:hypothetical protein